jgi:Uma2 family endonuclease
MASQPISRLTPGQDLIAEREAEFRSEYLNGHVCAMAGSTVNHARIVNNAVRDLSNQLSGGGCEVFSADLRLWSDEHRVYTYPDILVACAPLRYQDDRRDTVTDAPSLLKCSRLQP